MPVTTQAILEAAQQEWARWGYSTRDLVRGEEHIAHTDKEPWFVHNVILKDYCPVADAHPDADDIMQDKWAWSAVGLSYILRQAGFRMLGEHGGEFPFSARHADYLRYFVAARKQADLSAVYWAYRLGEPGGAPMPGDIVAYARPAKEGQTLSKKEAAARFDATGNYPSHGDVVVAVRDGECDVIGCNVSNSVTRKTLALDAQGFLADETFAWFAVLKRREV